MFEGLNILRETKLCEECLDQFPVISITLKSVEGADCREGVFTIKEDALLTSLKTLSQLLSRYYGKKVILLYGMAFCGKECMVAMGE